MDSTGLTQTNRSRRGRTPSINQALIEQAIWKVGQAGDVTMHGVAAELNVNVTTLYRHTGGLDGLKQIYARQLSETAGEAPTTKGRNWRQWLYALAEHYRKELLDHPDLLRFAQAALDPDFARLEQATKTLVEYGFDPLEAARAHAFLVNNVIGYVNQERQTAAEIADGSAPTYSKLAKKLQDEAERLPTLNALNLSDDDLDLDTNFRFFVNYTLDGIAARSGVSTQKRR